MFKSKVIGKFIDLCTLKKGFFDFSNFFLQMLVCSPWLCGMILVLGLTWDYEIWRVKFKLVGFYEPFEKALLYQTAYNSASKDIT